MEIGGAPSVGELDGCDHGMFDEDRLTADDEIDAVVLFADIDFTDPAAVAARVAEWEALWASG